MRTYPIVDEKKSKRPFAFEIENAYVGIRTIARLLTEVDGVSDVRRRRLFSKWDEIHIWFKYANQTYVVWEPFGDNSRYWIGPKSPEEAIDIRDVENAFKQHRPSFYREIAGDILSLRFIKRCIGRIARKV
jgi:hypothetical protein